MAHFARIDDGIVREVIVINNENCGGGNFPVSELAGQEFIASLGLTGEWKQTSYNGNFRGKYAGISDIYDSKNDVFVSPVMEVPNESFE